MHDTYNRSYLKNTLDVISDNLDDLEKWSVWNGDKKIDEIRQLAGLFKLIRKQMKGEYYE